MTVKEFFEYKLVDFESIHISVLTIFGVALIFVGAKIFLRLVKRLLRRRVEQHRLDKGRSDSFFQIVRYFVWSFAIFGMLQLFGVELTWLIAGGAALMVGVGLGLQNVFNDFVSGIILLFEGSIEVGNIIQIGDTDSTIGEVTKINLRTSRMLTRNNISVLVPNHKIIEDNIINWSHLKEHPRFHIDVGVAYGSDTEKVIKLLIEAAKSHSKVSKSPEPFARFIQFGDSSLNFQLFFWSSEIFRIDNVLSDVRLAVDKKFRQEGITIPFPQRDVHFFNHNKDA